MQTQNLAKYLLLGAFFMSVTAHEAYSDGPNHRGGRDPAVCKTWGATPQMGQSGDINCHGIANCKHEHNANPNPAGEAEDSYHLGGNVRNVANCVIQKLCPQGQEKC